MAIQRTAVVTSVGDLAPDVRVLELEPAEPLGFVGGQYIIVNTEIELPSQRLVKRPYSIVSSDREQGRFQLAVRRVCSGFGSDFMHGLVPGSRLLYSGPWGKLTIADPEAETLVVATDTGITAALGLLLGAACPARVRLVWLRTSGQFLPDAFVREALPVHCPLAILECAPPGSEARARAALPVFRGALRSAACQQAFLSGDGELVHAFKALLLDEGLAPARVRLECFFNNPERRAAA